MGRQGTRGLWKKTINPIQHGNNNPNNIASAGNVAVRHVFTLGLDVDLHFVVTAIQCDASEIKPARKFTRAELLDWVRKQVTAGHTVHTVYEACGFGYTLHEQLVEAGAHSHVTTPMRLNLERRCKNDRMCGLALRRRTAPDPTESQ